MHSLANGPEVKLSTFCRFCAVTSSLLCISTVRNHAQVSKPLLETSRHGYLAALSASTYSVSLRKHFIPIMNPGMFLT